MTDVGVEVPVAETASDEGGIRVSSDPARLVEQIAQYETEIPKREAKLVKFAEKIEHAKRRLQVMKNKLEQSKADGTAEKAARELKADLEARASKLAAMFNIQ